MRLSSRAFQLPVHLYMIFAYFILSNAERLLSYSASPINYWEIQVRPSMSGLPKWFRELQSVSFVTMNEQSTKQLFEMCNKRIYGTSSVYSDIMLRPPSWWLKWTSFWMIPLAKNSGNIHVMGVDKDNSSAKLVIDQLLQSTQTHWWFTETALVCLNAAMSIISNKNVIGLKVISIDSLIDKQMHLNICNCDYKFQATSVISIK